jgi:hypothetical protein
LEKALIVAQVSFAAALLTVSGLLLHSLVKLETVDTGFNRDHVAILSMEGGASTAEPYNGEFVYKGEVVSGNYFTMTH